VTLDLNSLKVKEEIDQFISSLVSTSSITFISNAGVLGSLTPTDSLDFTAIEESYRVNVVAPFYLTSRLISHFQDAISIRIVNVSSLAALQPFDCWSLYCSAKAARDMFHRSIGLEGEHRNIKTLNYAPGPLDTDMQKVFR
jgi:sepiapterin reductase